MATQELPFTVQIVKSEEQLIAACGVRSEAYGRHLPELRERLLIPDDIDTRDTTAVFLVRDKDTGRAISTVRIEMNTETPLQIEGCVPIPDEIKKERLAEVSRFAIVARNPLVNMAVVKCIYLYGLANQIQYVLLGARSGGLIRMYQDLGYVDLFPNEEMFPLPYAGGLPHRVLYYRLGNADQSHPHYDFVFRTCHPDINIFK